MPQDKISAIYKAITGDGYNVGSIQDFSNNIQNPEKAKALYSTLTKDGYELGDLPTFMNKVGHSSVQTHTVRPAPLSPETQAYESESEAPEVKGVSVTNTGVQYPTQATAPDVQTVVDANNSVQAKQIEQPVQQPAMVQPPKIDISHIDNSVMPGNKSQIQPVATFGNPLQNAHLPYADKTEIGNGNGVTDPVADIARGAASGIVNAGADIGQGIADINSKIGSAIYNLSDNPTYQKFVSSNLGMGRKPQSEAEVKQRADEIRSHAPQTTGKVGEIIGQTIPYIGLAAATVVQPELAPVTTGAFGAMGYGEGINTYDNYKKQTGQPTDELSRLGTGVLYAAANTVPIGGYISKILPRGAGGIITKALSMNPETTEQFGKAVLENYLQKSPSEATKLVSEMAKSTAGGVLSMEGMQLSKKAVDQYLVGMDVKPEDYWNTAKDAAINGAVFGAVMAPFAKLAQDKAVADRRNTQGSVSLTMDDKGNPIEVLPTNQGQNKGMTPGGKIVDLTPDQISNSFTLTTNDFNNAVEAYKQNKTVAPDIERTAFSGRVKQGLQNIADQDGNIYVPQDANSDIMAVTGRDANGQLHGIDYNGQTKPIDDIPVQKANIADVHDYLMNKYDEQQQRPVPEQPTTGIEAATTEPNAAYNDGYNADEADADRVNTDADYKAGAQQKFNEKLQAETNAGKNSIDNGLSAMQHTQDGKIWQAELYNPENPEQPTPVNIISGNIKQDADGNIDTHSSDSKVGVMLPNGEKHIVNLSDVVDATPFDVEEARANEYQMLNDNLSQKYADQYNKLFGPSQQVQPENTSEALPAQDTFTLPGIGEEVSVQGNKGTIQSYDSAGRPVIEFESPAQLNGRTVRVSPVEIDMLDKPQPDNNLSVTTQNEGIQPGQTQQNASEVPGGKLSEKEIEKELFYNTLPINKNGEADEAAMTPPQHVKYAEYELGKDGAVEVARDQSAIILKRIEKIDKQPKTVANIKQRQKLIEAKKVYDDYIGQDLSEKATEAQQRLAEQRENQKTDTKPDAKVEANITERWNNAPKIEGNEDEIKLANGEIIPGKYVLAEQGAFTPSHDVNKNFSSTEGFPTNERGENINDRDYANDKTAQALTLSMGNDFDRGAIGIVVDGKTGVTVSGNGRTMAGQLAAQQGTDAKYIFYITKYAKNYGFEPEQIQTMQHPRIVFVPDSPVKLTTENFKKFNADEKKTQSTVEKAKANSKALTKETIQKISVLLSDVDNLSDVYNDPQRTSELLNMLLKDGVIQPTEVAQLQAENGTLTGTGRDMFESLVLGSAFETKDIQQISKFSELQKSVIFKSVSTIITNKTLGDYSLSNELSEAIALVTQANVAGTNVETEGRALSLFDDPNTKSVILLAKAIDEKQRTKNLSRIFDTYNNSAKVEVDGTMFYPRTRERILTDLLEKYGYNTGLSEQKIADATQRGTGSELGGRNGGQIEGERGLDTTGSNRADEGRADELSSGTGVDATIAEQHPNTEPTEAQKEAGNYKKAHVTVQGMDITIENPKSSVRKGVDEDGKAWEHTMQSHYGYFKRTTGKDGDHIDVFVGPNENSPTVYVIDQNNHATGAFDESKVMLGYNSPKEAKQAYLENYDKDWKGFGSITPVSVEDFKKWLYDGARQRKPFSEYVDTPKPVKEPSKLELKLQKAQEEFNALDNDSSMRGIAFVSGGNLSKASKSKLESYRNKLSEKALEIANLKKAIKIDNEEPFTLKDVNKALSDFAIMPDDFVNERLPLTRAAEIIRDSFEGKMKSYSNKDILLDYNTTNKIVWRVTPDGKVEQAYEKWTNLQQTDKRLNPVTHQFFDNIVGHLQKAFPNTKVITDAQAMHDYLVKKFGKKEADRFMAQDFRDSHTAPAMMNDTLEEAIDESGDVNLAEIITGKQELVPEDYFDTRMASTSGGQRGFVGAIRYGNNTKHGNESLNAIKKLQDEVKKWKDIKTLTAKVYRTIPKSVDENKLIQHDWVTLSKTYAEMHGLSRFGEGEYKIIEQEVPLNTLWWDGNDINEFGYDNTPNVRFLRTSKGEVYGFTTPEGNIYIDPDKINANTPIHEFGHLWNSIAMKNNPDMWTKITELCKQTKGWKELSNNPAYAHLKTDSQKADEVFATLLGNRGEKNVKKLLEESNNDITLFAKIKDAIRRFWNWLKETLFGIKPKMNSAEKGEKFVESNDRFQISDKNNPIDDEYLAAIKSRDLERANEIVLEQARKNGYINDNDYRMSHRAPGMEPDTTSQERVDNGYDTNVEDIAKGYSLQPDDYFDERNGAKWYGYDTLYGRESSAGIKSAIRSIQSQMNEFGEVKEMPKIKVYRAVPKSIKETKFRNGDWVTPSYSYATNHGKAYVDGPYKIMEEEVPANHLWWDANDVNEWGVDNGQEYTYRNTKNNKKLLDTITYDDKGNIIPPSNRFNSRNSDIRFQSLNTSKDKITSDINSQVNGELATLRKELAAKGRELFNAQQSISTVQQQKLFENGQEQQGLFDIQADISKENSNRILDPIKASIKKLEEDIKATEAGRQKRIDEALDAYDKQLTLFQNIGNKIDKDFDSSSIEELNAMADTALKEMFAGKPIAEQKKFTNFESVNATQNEISEQFSQGKLGTDNENNSRIQEIASECKRRSEKALRDAQEAGRTLSQRERKEIENQSFKDYAQENNLWTPIQDTFNLGEPLPGGMENEVYLNTEEKAVYKVNNLLNANGSIPELLSQITNHNNLFPGTKINLVGFTGTGNSTYPILKQDYVSGEPATPEEISDYMNKLGFSKLSNSSYTNGDITVSDLLPRNVLKDTHEDLNVIDDIVRKNNVINQQSVPEYADPSQYDFDVKGITPANADEMKRIKDEAVAADAYMKAPNGEPTNLNERQWLQVRTPQFKDWFGDWENDPENASKVIDANGEPMVVYHGTGEKFNKFEAKDGALKKGSYFSSSFEEAVDYAAEKLGVKLSGENDFGGDFVKDGNVIESFLDIKDNDRIGKSNYGTREYIYSALPSQIKSATTNNGNFDESSDDIRFMAEPEGGTSTGGYKPENKAPQRSDFKDKNEYARALLSWSAKNAQNIKSKPSGGKSTVTMPKPETEDNRVRDAYERAMGTAKGMSKWQQTQAIGGKLREGWQDRMYSLLVAQREIEKQTGAKIEDWENPYLYENQLSSINTEEAKRYEREHADPLEFEVRKLMTGAMTKESISNDERRNAIKEAESKSLLFIKNKIDKGKRATYTDIIKYMYAKHGLERNGEMAFRAAVQKAASEKEAGATREQVKEWENTMINQYKFEKTKLEAIKTFTKDEAKYATDLEALRQRLAPDYDSFKDKDYSGLTGLTAIKGEEWDEKTHQFIDRIDEDGNKVEIPFRERAEKIVRDFEEKHNPSDLWKQINGATQATLQKGFESGLLSREQYNNLKDMYRYYVPLRGFNEQVAEDVYQYQNEDLRTSKGSVFKSASGRKSMADDPLATMFNNYDQAIVQANRNVMRTKFYNMALNHPTSLITVGNAWYATNDGGETWSLATPDLSAFDNKVGNAEEIANQIADFEEKMQKLEEKGLAHKGNAGLDIDYKASKQQKSQHAVVVKVNGNEKVIYVNGNPRLAQAVNGEFISGATSDFGKQAEAASKAIEQTLRPINNFLAQSFTSNNPNFMLVNLVRDSMFSNMATFVREDTKFFLQFTKNQAKITGQIYPLLYKHEHNTLDVNNPIERYFKEFVENGAETGYMSVKEVEDYRKNIKRELADLDANIVKAGYAKTKNALRAAGTGFEFVNRGIEDINRFATYLTARENGFSIERSVEKAKNISVNFNKKGSGAYGASAARGSYLFLNAGIQSMQNYNSLWIKTGKKGAAKMAIAHAIPFMVASLLVPLLVQAIASALGEDSKKALQEYNELPDYIRKTNLVFYSGNGTFVLIPIGMEQRAPFGLGDVIYQYVNGNIQHKNFGLEVANQLLQILPMNPAGDDFSLTPAAAAPLVDVARNKNYFGSPIYYENEWNKDMPEFTKANKGTPEMLVKSSEVWNNFTGGNKYRKGNGDIGALNPSVIWYLAQGYAGGVGKTAMQVFATGEGLADGQVMNRNIPIWNRFVHKMDEYPVNSTVKNKFNFYHEIYDENMTEIKKLGKDKLTEKSGKLLDFVQSDEYKYFGAMRATDKRIEKLNKQRKQADTPEEQEDINKKIEDEQRKFISFFETK